MKNGAKTFIIFCLFIQHLALKSQTWQMSAGTNYAEGSMRLSRDPYNNLYLYPGRYGYPGPDTIIKLDTNGIVLWKMVMPTQVRITCFSSPGNSSFYMGGVFTGSFANGADTYSAAVRDIWFGKFSTVSGNSVWVKTIQTKHGNELGDIAVMNGKMVLTGMLDDTATFGNQAVPKKNSPELFIALADTSGNLLSVNFADNQAPPPDKGYSWGMECETDKAGNIYVLGTARNNTKVDTFNIGGGLQTGNYDTYTSCIMKLNPLLDVQYVHKLQSCYYYCNDFANLRVNSKGEAFVVGYYSYGQSGNDINNSHIRKIATNGTLQASYRPKPNLDVAIISDIQLDDCDNIYFTGFWRYYIYSNPLYYALLNGQLNSSLTVQWLREDSSATNAAAGNALAVLGYNNLFINGWYADTLSLTNTISTGTNTAGFYARIKSGTFDLCKLLSDVPALGDYRSTRFYPNPSTGKVNIETVGLNCVDVYDTQGRLVKQINGSAQEIDLSSLQDGFYILKIGSASGISCGKVLLCR